MLNIETSHVVDSLEDICLREKIPAVSWERHGKNDKFTLHFDGVPYIFLGTREYQCHQGNDKNKCNKDKHRKKKNELVRGIDHTQHIKSRKLAQPTKKLDCPVTFTVKKLYRFPEYKILKRYKLATFQYV